MDKTALTISTYNKIADIYTNKYFADYSDKKYLNKFLKLLPNNANLLDIGCGPGQFAQYIKSKGYNIEGIDLSDEILRIAKEKIPDLEFKKMDMRKMSYKNNTFDGLLVAYSLIHIQSYELPNTLKEFNRILKPGGYTMIIVQTGESDRVVDEPMLKGEKIFVNFFTPKRLSDFLINTGFKLVFQKETTTKDIESFSNKVIYTISSKK